MPFGQRILIRNKGPWAFYAGGTQLGELEAGGGAALFGVSFSVASGGIITLLLTAWIASRYPALRAYRSGSETRGTRL